MLIQRAGSGTRSPPGFTVPNWQLLIQQWKSIPLPCSPDVIVGPATITLGHDDSEAEDDLPGIAQDVIGHTFGWDNESPARVIEVGAFRAEWRPVTNKEFEIYRNNQGKGVVDLPKSWIEEDGDIKVRCLPFNSVQLALNNIRFELSMG